MQRSKLDKEEIIYQIRQQRINGLNKALIVKALGITGDTYDNYIQIIYQQDSEILAKKREQALATDIELYKNRLEKALRNLNVLLNDGTATVKEKVELIKTQVEISNKLLRVESEGTALLELKPELRQAIEDANAMVRNKIEINQYNIQQQPLEDKSKVIKINKVKDEDLFG